MPKTKQVFFSYSYAHREEHQGTYLLLKELLENNGFSCYSFVFDFTDQVDEKTLMVEALRKIDDSDIFIADPCFGSFGIGIEAGYAKARNKTIIYLHELSTSLEETLVGISDHLVDYSDSSDLTKWFTGNISILGK